MTVFYLLVVLGAIILWFLLSNCFVPLGNLCHRLWKDAVDEINKEDESEEVEDEKEE